MRRLGALALLCAVSSNTYAAQSAQRKTSIPPDVFLITIDTLRADHVHCYGYDRVQTPALDALAKSGVRFSEAFTPSPITNTSHASILTGLMPERHGMVDFGVPLSAGRPTLAELLKAHGYATAAFIGSVILDSRKLAPGLDRGFDFYDNFAESTGNKSRWNRLERRGATVAEHAEAWLNRHVRGPRFIWIHLYDPHDPYEPPAPYDQTYEDHLYDGEIAYTDSVLAGFFQYLKRRGWYEGSLVIAVGDHGEGLGEHHEDTHGIFLYDSTTHVPLIVKLPQRRSDLVIDSQVSTLDIFPTVLDLLHFPSPELMDGLSLTAHIVSGEKNSHVVLGETDYPLRFGWASLRSIRSDGFKFIEAPRPELYNLHDDPAESQNAYAPWEPTVQKFRNVLLDWKKKSPPPDSSAGSVPQSTIDELKALGYFRNNDAASSTNAPEPSMLPDPKDHIQEQNLLHQAMMAEEQGQVEDARAALENVVELDPNSSLGLTELADLEWGVGEAAKSAALLKKARATRPNDATLAFKAGRALERLGDVNGAREALEASATLAPTEFSTRLLLGRVYLQLKNAKAAEDQFQAAMLLQPLDPQAQLGLAKSQISREKFREALPELQSLAKSQPDSPEVFDLLSNAYSGLGQSDEAQAARSRADSLRKKQSPAN